MKYRFLLFFIIGLSACDDCEPEIEKLPPLTEKEKAIIPARVGDSLFFKDQSGGKFYLVCTSNKLIEDGHYDTSHSNSCEDNSTIWDKQVADFSGNLTTDKGANLKIITSVAGNVNEGEFRQVTCGNYSTNRRFIMKLDEQLFFGNANENDLPAITEFNFKPIIKLDGELFQDINFKTNSTCVKDYGLGIDSIYYSTTLGLIRLTTLGSKKYQRIL